MPETIYDVAIIGSGPAGYTAAIRAGQLGLKTALIEKDPYLGGTCLHVGCIPTKALLFNAEVYDHVKEGAELGLENTAGVTAELGRDPEAQAGHRRQACQGPAIPDAKNKVDVIDGYGKLTGPAKDGIHTVAIEGGEQKSIKAKNVILSTGSVARMLPGMQPDEQILTNIEVLSLNDIPKSLIVIGSGAVGVEFASIYKSFGADVTILEMLPRYVPVEDEEVSKELMRVYRKRGINGFVNAKVEKVEKTEDRRGGDLHRRRQAAEDRSREGADRRRPRAAHGERRHREDEDQGRARLREGRRATCAPPSRASTPSATSSRAIRSWRILARWKASSPSRTSPASRRSRSTSCAFPTPPIAIRRSAASA